MVVSDTSILPNLAAIEQLCLLPRLYGSIVVPEAVYRELVRRASRPLADRATMTRRQHQERLDPGEAKAMALTLELGAASLPIASV